MTSVECVTDLPFYTFYVGLGGRPNEPVSESSRVFSCSMFIQDSGAVIGRSVRPPDNGRPHVDATLPLASFLGDDCEKGIRYLHTSPATDTTREGIREREGVYLWTKTF